MMASVFLLLSIVVLLCMRRVKLEDRIRYFSEGAGNSDLLMMVWIFVLAGAFSQSERPIGPVDATVTITLHVLPNNMLLPGIFLAACFISLAMGTSVGTIVALTPVAVGIANQTSVSVAFMTALVVGGAFFGDNLSFISDTTIAATRSMGCKMLDKFKSNSRIAIPAAVLVLAYYVIRGWNIVAPTELPEVEWIKVLPYLLVLVVALCGVNVMLVLVLGILASGIIGFCTASQSVLDWFSSIGEGVIGMGELILISLMAGGILNLIRVSGAMAKLIGILTRKVKGPRGAALSIAALVSVANLCTANNTIAIISVGQIARQIADKFGVDKRFGASILDTFSCLVQGLIPYGAQLLMASGLALISPLSIVGYLYYPMALGVAALLAISIKSHR